MPLPDLSQIKFFLASSLPQEWQVTKSEQTTCQGPVTFLRIESGPKMNGRQFICAIAVKDTSVQIITPLVYSPEMEKVTAALKSIVDCHLVFVECPLNCENCSEAWVYFH